MKNLWPAILIIFIACNQPGEKTASNPKNLSSPDTGRPMPRQEQVRLPQSEFELTGGGIGKLLLGDPFNSVDSKFANFDTLTMSSEGYDWPAKQIDLGHGEWILVESNDGGASITRLHTNSRYKTSKGFYVGQPFEEVLKSGEKMSIDVDEGSISIRLHGENVSIHIDPASLNQLSKSQDQEIKDIPGKAKIAEFGIF